MDDYRSRVPTPEELEEMQTKGRSVRPRPPLPDRTGQPEEHHDPGLARRLITRLRAGVGQRRVVTGAEPPAPPAPPSLAPESHADYPAAGAKTLRRPMPAAPPTTGEAISVPPQSPRSESSPVRAQPEATPAAAPQTTQVPVAQPPVDRAGSVPPPPADQPPSEPHRIRVVTPPRPSPPAPGRPELLDHRPRPAICRRVEELGHTLGPFTRSGDIEMAYCTRCGMKAEICWQTADDVPPTWHWVGDALTWKCPGS
jgi:hypothetical protein